MLLSVAKTANEVEHVRKCFVSLGYFTYCATFEEMVKTAEKFPLTDLVIVTRTVEESLKDRVESICALYPNINLFLLSDDYDHGLTVRRQMPYDMDAYEVLFQILYYSKPSPNSTEEFHENLLVKGMLFNSYRGCIHLYGWLVPFHQSEVFLLRYLGEIYPRRADNDELAELCFGYGKKATSNAVKSRISRINKHAIELVPALHRPIVTYKKNEGGYQIDF